MALAVRPISSAEHLAFLAARPAASFLQCPSWAAVKQEWGSRSLGWYDDSGELVGAGLVLLRQVPKVKKFLAYLPEGPVLDWAADDLAAWLTPMVEHLRGEGAFGVKMGPPVVRRRWSAATVKAAIAEGSARRLADVPPDSADDAGERVAATLRELGWRPPSTDEGFAAGQPQYVFQVPLAGRDEDELLKGFNQLWRRNIKKADKLGVVVRQGVGRGPAGLPCAVPRDRRARPLHRPAAVVLPADVGGDAGRGPGPDPALPRRARGRPGGRDDDGAGRRARLVLLRRLVDGEARGARLERRAVGDAARREGGRRDGLRPARHHRHAVRGRPALRADPVQARHRRRGRRVPRRVGPAAEQGAVQGVRPLHDAADEHRDDLHAVRRRAALARAPAGDRGGGGRASCRSSRATATGSATSGWPRRLRCSASTPWRSARRTSCRRCARRSPATCWC